MKKLVPIQILIWEVDREIVRAEEFKVATYIRRKLAERCGLDPEAFNRNVNTPGGYRERREQETDSE